MREDMEELHISLADREWTLCRSGDLESAWQAMSEGVLDEDERLPYWRELWPSSIGLGNWLVGQRTSIFNQPCLDMGCGLGLTAMLARWLGSRVLGMDYEPDALRCAARGARLSGVNDLPLALMDWRKPAVKPGAFAYIWGADIMYEARFAAPIAEFLLYALAPGGIVWLAEPGRTIYQVLVEALFRRGFSARRAYTQMVNEPLANPVPVPVTVWEIHKPL